MPLGASNDTWPGSLPPGTARPAPPPVGLAEIPEHIGPYAVEELVGRGGMAAVFRCRDEAGEVVAVKWLHLPSAALQERFAREIASLARAHHPGVVRYLDHGSWEGRPYLVMEFLQGDDLRLWSHRLRRLPALERSDRIRRLAVRLAEALGHLHAQGLVHRDVKPSNVLVLEQDEPVLTDLGVVKDLADDGETAMGVVVGTLNYASPEQLRGGAVDARSDLYSLGCTLYFVLTGHVPFEGGTQGELVMAHLQRPPVPPSHHDPSIGADIEQVVLRLMAKEPAERYAAAREVAEALTATPTPAGVPLAGRKAAMAQVAEALDRVAGGRGCAVGVVGPHGTGKSWVLETLQEGARRRQLRYLEPHEPAALRAALARVEAGEALVVATELPLERPDVLIRLEPLRRADLRRSVVAVARDARDPAGIAERLYRATGGLPALLLPLLRTLAADPRALDGDLPPISVDRWLDPLDLDCLEVLQAVAAAGVPVSASQVEAITQVPADEPLRVLLDAGLLVAASAEHGLEALHPGRGPGRRFAVTAQAFALGALARAPDLEGLKAHVAAVLGVHGEEAAHPELPDLRAVHERLACGDLAEAERELGLLRVTAGADAPLHRRVGLQLAQARADWLAGRLPEARRSFEEALAGARPGVRAAASARLGLGVVALCEGRAADAASLLENAAALAGEGAHLDLEIIAAVCATWVQALRGCPGPALRAASRLVGVAHALALPAPECAALELHGMLLLETGATEEAARLLADISALAHAAGLARERWQAHALRARTTLDQDPGSPTAAAAATDRLLRVLAEPPAPDPFGFRALAHALLARAGARLADARAFRHAAELADRGTAGCAGPVALSGRLQLARAFQLGGERDRARDLCVETAGRADAAGWTLLAWQARRLEAAFTGAPPFPAGDLLAGMEPALAELMQRRAGLP